MQAKFVKYELGYVILSELFMGSDSFGEEETIHWGGKLI